MVDRMPNDTPPEGLGPFFSGPEEATEAGGRFARIEQLTHAHAILGRSLELNKTLSATQELTKKFVTVTTGNPETYPFLHYRIKMKPKNRVESQIKVAALRYPLEHSQNITGVFAAETLYIAWETLDGAEYTYVLDVDAFSGIDLSRAFTEEVDGTRGPLPESRNETDEIEQFLLQSILRDFEPDLQTTDVDVKA